MAVVQRHGAAKRGTADGRVYVAPRVGLGARLDGLLPRLAGALAQRLRLRGRQTAAPSRQLACQRRAAPALVGQHHAQLCAFRLHRRQAHDDARLAAATAPGQVLYGRRRSGRGVGAQRGRGALEGRDSSAPSAQFVAQRSQLTLALVKAAAKRRCLGARRLGVRQRGRRAPRLLNADPLGGRRVSCAGRHGAHLRRHGRLLRLLELLAQRAVLRPQVAQLAPQAAHLGGVAHDNVHARVRFDGGRDRCEA